MTVPMEHIIEGLLLINVNNVVPGVICVLIQPIALLLMRIVELRIILKSKMHLCKYKFIYNLKYRIYFYILYKNIIIILKKIYI